MARSDWRSASAYEDLRPLDAPAFAYEFLRRNADFLADHTRLTRKARRHTLDNAETEEFARRWGVRFQGRSPPAAVQDGTVDAPGASNCSRSDRGARWPRRS